MQTTVPTSMDFERSLCCPSSPFMRFPINFLAASSALIFSSFSGYLISSIIFSNLEIGRFSIVEFYDRRVRRIFPALLIVMGCSLAFGWTTFFADEYTQLGKHVAGGAAFVSNFLLYHESGYFDNSSETKPMLHLWSLAIEEQFYIFWPLLLTFAWKRKWSFLPITAVIAIASFAANIYLTLKLPAAAFYWPISRFWELMIGGLLAYVAAHKPSLFRKGKNQQSSLGVVLLIACAILINQKRDFPGWWALLPTVAAFFIVSAGPEGWFNKYVLSTRYLVWFGLISYPLYLWHWPLLSVVKIIEGSAGKGRIIRIEALAVAVGLAWLTYRFVETPIRRKGDYRTAWALVAAMLVMATMALGIVQFHGVESRAAIRNSTFTPQSYAQFSGYLWRYTSNSSCLRRFPFKGSGEFKWWFCMLEKDQPPTFILMGNSYANELYPGLTSIPELAKQNVLSIGTCDPGHLTVDPRAERDFPCYGNRPSLQENFIDRIIVENQSIRYAILDGLSDTPDEDYTRRLKERIDFLESRSVQVFVFYPHLVVDFDMRECFSRPLFPAKRSCILPLSLRKALTLRFKPLVDSIHASNPKVVFFDQNDLFCNDRNCSLILDGLPLYRDDAHHISEFGSDRVAELFVTFLHQNMPAILN